MEESSSPQEPLPGLPSGAGRIAPKPDLIARLYEEPAKFVQLQVEFAQFRSGYSGRLNDGLQVVYGLDDAFRQDADEFRRLTNLDFFECNRQKPDETNLLRHIAYFLADARTEQDREKWLKPAAVLESFRSQGVPVQEVARRLKEGGGYARLYKSLPGKASEANEASDDLSVLQQDPNALDDIDVEPLNAVDTVGGPPNTLSDKRGETALMPPVPVADQDDEVVEPGASTARSDHTMDNPASPKVATISGDAISGQAENQKRTSRTRVDLDTTVPVIIPPMTPGRFSVHSRSIR
ncbi:MAG: hypothetical protein ACLPN5_08555 [Roseiarcus sp.]